MAVVVEGQTEEAFVNVVLQPLASQRGMHLTPIVVHTSRSADGRAHRGGGNWAHYERLVRNLVSQPHWDRVTTMLDFYAFPSGGPVCGCSGSHKQPTCVDEIELRMGSTLGSPEKFRPFVMLHEFETLVIAAGAEAPDIFDDRELPATFARLIDEHGGNAELINNGRSSAPSKRVVRLLPDYDKVRDGVAIIFPHFKAALAATPHMKTWMDELGLG
ncbi:DUF4276 family protein [Curtobacterium sp. Csp1]|uniref:DUF4276 family protein n=1 Tax=unclassified Curtobacterium TaxID=257496 RepID=UPI001599BEFF|nr:MULTISPECIES: DUF4276 family protein [unclassified Curtobacterium]QKS14105.1 DUF4276 family protein [Curtobacterium sp. csp3]QKS21189.1 DUF4276 family protein [Curtobacterium sp. Csp1]QKS21689.1 DUF4276 family protein [Curtobacterium sp. Csp1]